MDPHRPLQKTLKYFWTINVRFYWMAEKTPEDKTMEDKTMEKYGYWDKTPELIFIGMDKTRIIFQNILS